jgi:CRP/FNR family transcriptional regulator, cyclic AMP receptor protein
MSQEFWDQLTPDEAEALQQVARRRDYRRGTVLMREADRSDWVFILRSGRVKVSVDTSSGTEVVLAVRGPGALLGEFSALDREPRSATVTALEPVSGLIVPLAEFESFLQAHGRVAYLLIRTVISRLRDADRKRIEFGAHDTIGRVAARLIEMADRFGQPTADGLKIALPFSQDELAGWIGASREAVSKALGVLRQAGTIKTSRMSVVVRDLPDLRRRAE